MTIEELFYDLVITTDALIKATSDGEQSKRIAKIVKDNLKDMGLTLKKLKELADEID
jgi:hypothetical protein